MGFVKYTIATGGGNDGDPPLPGYTMKEKTSSRGFKYNVYATEAGQPAQPRAVRAPRAIRATRAQAPRRGTKSKKRMTRRTIPLKSAEAAIRKLSRPVKIVKEQPLLYGGARKKAPTARKTRTAGQKYLASQARAMAKQLRDAKKLMKKRATAQKKAVVLDKKLDKCRDLLAKNRAIVVPR